MKSGTEKTQYKLGSYLLLRTYVWASKLCFLVKTPFSKIKSYITDSYSIVFNLFVFITMYWNAKLIVQKKII